MILFRLVRVVEIGLGFVRGPKMTWFSVDFELLLVFVWLVEIDFISVWGIEFDLMSVRIGIDLVFLSVVEIDLVCVSGHRSRPGCGWSKLP